MGIIKKITHISSLIIEFLIIIYAIICTPLLFGYHPLVVLSGSMKPTYQIGSIVYYKKISIQDLKAGDIITFDIDGKTISHRITKIENKQIETKGDANEIPDGDQITEENIRGKATPWSLPYVGTFVRSINAHLLSTILTAVSILVLDFLFSNIEFNKNKKGGIS